MPDVPVRVTRGAVIAHRYTYAPPRCRTSQYRLTFIPLSVSLWNDPSDPVFDGAGLAGFKSRANAFLLTYLLAHFLSPAVFHLSSSFYGLVLWCWGLRTDGMLIALSQPCITKFFFLNNNKNNSNTNNNIKNKFQNISLIIPINSWRQYRIF